jgi:hypothetical protein
VTDPLTLGTVSQPGSWPARSAAARWMNAFWFVANAISYALDSIPLSRTFDRMLSKDHAGDVDSPQGAPSSWRRFLMVSMPPWLFALVLAHVVPSLFCMLAVVTALTVPVANNILPSVFYMAWMARGSPRISSVDGALPAQEGTLNQSWC